MNLLGDKYLRNTILIYLLVSSAFLSLSLIEGSTYTGITLVGLLLFSSNMFEGLGSIWGYVAGVLAISFLIITVRLILNKVKKKSIFPYMIILIFLLNLIANFMRVEWGAF